MTAPLSMVPKILEQTGSLGGKEAAADILPFFLFERSPTFFYVYWVATVATILNALGKRMK